MSSALPSTATHLYASCGSTTSSEARGSCSRFAGFLRPSAVLNDGDAVLDVDPHDGGVRRAVLAQRRDDADVGFSRNSLLLLGQLRPSVSPRFRVTFQDGLPQGSTASPRLIIRGPLPILRDMRIALAILVAAILGTAFVFHERALGSSASSAPSRRSSPAGTCTCTARASPATCSTSPPRRAPCGSTPTAGRRRHRPEAADLRRAARLPARRQEQAFGCVLAQADCPHAIFEDVLAVHTLAHESWHLRGETSESVAECNALQTTASAAMLLGADPRAAQAVADYALSRLYPNCPTSTGRHCAGTAGRWT